MSKPVFIPLGRGGKKDVAVIDREDWEFLQRLGLSTSWNLSNEGSATAPERSAPGRQVSVARVLMNAGERQQVKHRDGNKLNLRRENLELVQGGAATRRDRSYVNPKPTKKARSTFLSV